MQLNVTILCGMPLVGKTSIASRVSKKLDIHWIDIDELAVHAFGAFRVIGKDKKIIEERRKRTAMAYELLNQVIRISLESTEFLHAMLITAPYSRKSSWIHLNRILNFYDIIPNIILLEPSELGTKSIRERLEKRISSGSYKGDGYCPVDLDEYYKVLQRFEPPNLPHTVIHTWPKYCVSESVEFVLQALKKKRLPNVGS